MAGKGAGRTRSPRRRLRRGAWPAGAGPITLLETTHPVHIRDSKDTGGPVLNMPRTGWAAFLQYATAG
ncbi:MAG TPA: DUF397 domain-containing protein [Streptomyces sp.]|nr:DUF397 domain-containing protein [Streptomyces sp.]